MKDIGFSFTEVKQMSKGERAIFLKLYSNDLEREKNAIKRL